MFVGFKPINAHQGSANRSQREKPRVGIVFDSEYVTVTNDDIFGHSATAVERSSEDEVKKICLERKFATKVNSLPGQRHRSRLGCKLASEVISHGLEVEKINSVDELHETECQTFIYNVLSESPDIQQEQKQVASETEGINNFRLACDVYPDIKHKSQDENDDLESQSLNKIPHNQTSEFGTTMVSDNSIAFENYKFFCDAYSGSTNLEDEMYEAESHSLAYDFDSNCFIRYRKPSAANRLKRQILVYNVVPDGVDDKKHPVENRLSIVTIASPHNRERYGEESGTSSRINYSSSRQSHPPQIIAHVIDKIKKNQCECVMPVSTKVSSAPIKLPMYSRDILTDDTEKEKKNNPLNIFQESYMSSNQASENKINKEIKATGASCHKKGSKFMNRDHSKEKSKYKKKLASQVMKECATETDKQNIGRESDQISEVIQCGSPGINPMTRMADMKHSNPQFTPLLTDIRNNVRSFVSKMESRSVKCSNTNLFCKFRTLVFGDCSSECTSSKSKECANSCSQSTNCYNVAAKAESSFFKTIGGFISEGRDKIYERLQESKSQKSRMDESINAESSHSPPTSVEEVKKKKKKQEKRKHKHKIEIGTIEDDGVPLLSSNRIKIDSKKGYPLITANKIECYIY